MNLFNRIVIILLILVAMLLLPLLLIFPEQAESALRYAALGVVAAAGGWTVAKRRRLVAEGICINDGVCQGCNVLAECGLPAARSARAMEQKGDYGRAK